MALELLILLAIIQGLTEFLPISSSAHLILPSELGLIPDQGTTIDVAVHLGSLAAVMIYFRKDVVTLINGFFDTIRFQWTWDAKLFLYLAVATVPTLFMGAFIAFIDAEDALRSAELIGWTSIVFGLLLYEVDRIAGRFKTVENITWGGAMLVGLSQVLALLPGTSRSGITITAGRFLGFERSEAARFSMLLAIPTILAIGGFKMLDVVDSGDPVLQGDVMAALGLSFLAAYGSIFVFMKLVDRIGLLPFVIYRVLLGVGLLAFVYLLA